MEKNSTLEFVDLRENLIEDAGLLCMGKGLMKNQNVTKLKTIDLQDNRIGGYGVSKELPGLFQLTEAMYQHAVRKSEKAQLFLAGNSIKTYLGVELKEKYDESELDVFVDVQS